MYSISKDNIAIYQDGDPSNQSIVFVHGFPYDHTMWDEQVKVLKSSYNCIRYDIRGLGKSPAGDGQFTMESLVDDLSVLMEELNLNKPVLCGLSMGGYLSLRAVERMEEKFAGLILCDTKADADDNAGKLKRADGIKKINTEGLKSFVDVFIPNCFADASKQKLGSKYEKILSESAGFDPAGVKGCLIAMLSRTDTNSYLPKIKIPVLVMCGEEDKLTSAESMKAMADKIPGAKFVVVPGAGHMSPIESPEFVSKEFMNFLSENIKS